jgi:hypothetical protein
MPDRQRLFKLWNPAKRVFRGIFMTLVTLWLLVFAVGLLLTAYEVGGLPAVLIVIRVIASGVSVAPSPRGAWRLG